MADEWMTGTGDAFTGPRRLAPRTDPRGDDVPGVRRVQPDAKVQQHVAVDADDHSPAALSALFPNHGDGHAVQLHGRAEQRQDTSSNDGITGENVTYAYDTLNRLIKAETAANSWGNSYGYDGWGNLLTKTVTKDRRRRWRKAVDPATNRVVGVPYDANGNPTSLYVTYDVENHYAPISTLNGGRYLDTIRLESASM